jgi:hypothetical protein
MDGDFLDTGQRVQMSIYQWRRTVAPEKSLSALAHDTAKLDLQLSELYKLRDRVRQAELSARKSRRERLDSLSRAELHSGARGIRPQPHMTLIAP